MHNLVQMLQNDFLSNISGMWFSANTVKMSQEMSDLNHTS